MHLVIPIHLPRPSAIPIDMNSSQNVDEKVLLATARVQAAIELVSCMVGTNEACALWMREHLEAELASTLRFCREPRRDFIFYFQDRLPTASQSSPHPRLLGSLSNVLLRYYVSGMRIDALRFEDVRADDPSVEGSMYVDVLSDALPELKGDNFWWRLPPPSGE